MGRHELGISDSCSYTLLVLVIFGQGFYCIEIPSQMFHGGLVLDPIPDIFRL